MPKVSPRNFLIADDIRREDNGKQIHIGVYDYAVLVRSVPVLLPTFCIRCEFLPNREKHDAVVTIKSPENATIFEATVNMEVARTGVFSSFVVRASPIVFETAGDYTVLVGIDQPPEMIGTFKVGLVGEEGGPSQAE